jgi:diketogulonate reductase-like aldo/keto reductase
MAVSFAARTCRDAAIPVLAIASSDPFWRVRVAARRAAAALDAAVELPGAPVTQPASDDDPDPAVVTARLRRDLAGTSAEWLVAHLGNPHQALRRLAIVELGRRGDTMALRHALGWLEDDRVPYAPAAAEAALARAGAGAAALAGEVLGSDASPAGALAWALGARGVTVGWWALAAFLRWDDARVRRAALLLAPGAAPGRDCLLEAMSVALGDGNDEVRVLAATWLARTGGRAARDLLRRVSPVGQPTAVRARIVEAHARAGDEGALRGFAGDPHGGVRAAAIEALCSRNALDDAERRALRGDADPWVRQAALTSADAAGGMLDTSTAVRRSALELLSSEQRGAWAEQADVDADAELRARAVSILRAAQSDASTKRLLTLARDPDLGVRSAAVDALTARIDDVRRVVVMSTSEQRIAAYTTLALADGDVPEAQETDPAVVAHLALLRDVTAGRTPSSGEIVSSEPVPSPNVRPLGRSGLVASPLGISGAHGLSFDDLALAHERGVRLFFWEPPYAELGRFLRKRGRDAVVVAGTYHADAESIERDVDRARRALGRDVLDVFLAFWARSPTRLDEVAAPLRSLVDRGLVRAVGISTHDRALACDAVDRGLDVVMVRHSAAHRGAESSVFPRAVAARAAVLTFSNLCYGRMLHGSPAPLSSQVTAADCHRYSLSQPGVSACIGAPRRRSELLENLDVLDAPWLSSTRQAELRAHGDHVYARSKAWSAETWSVATEPRPAVVREHESPDDWLEGPELLGGVP